MDLAVLEQWLRRRLRRDANLALGISPLALLGGLLVLFLTFWFSYAVIHLVGRVGSAGAKLLLNVDWNLGHTGRLWLAGAFLVLLLVSYFRSDRSGVDWNAWEADPSALGSALARFGTGAGRAGLLLAHPEMSARLIVDILNLGPRLMAGGMDLLRQSGQGRAADTMAGARVLWTLLDQPRMLTYEELGMVYDSRELTRAFQALRLIEGVTFLERGVTLSTELRGELNGLRRGG